MNEPHRSRKEGPEREPDSGRTVARALSATRSAVHQPDQRARLGQDGAAGADAAAHGQELARCGAHRRSANRERRAAAGEVRLSGEADHDRRNLPSRCQDDWKASRGLEAGRPRPADRGERRQPGLPLQLRSWRRREDRAAKHDRRRRQAAEISLHLFQVGADVADQDRSAALRSLQRGRGARKRPARPSQMEIIDVSSTTGEGLDRWMEWLRARQERAKTKLQTATAPH